jgi:hypothetical protein
MCSLPLHEAAAAASRRYEGLDPAQDRPGDGLANLAVPAEELLWFIAPCLRVVCSSVSMMSAMN